MKAILTISLIALLSLQAAAKCTAVPSYMVVRTGGVTWHTTAGGDWDNMMGTIYPGTADSVGVEMTFSEWQCGTGSYVVRRDNVQVASGWNLTGTTTAWFTTPGVYQVVADYQYDDYGTTSYFTISGSPSPLTQVQVQVQAFLEGAMPATPQSYMRDDLRAAGLVPTMEPYTALGYAQVGSGDESVAPAVLAVTGGGAVVDWVHLELRSATTPSQIVATRNALITRGGWVVDLDGFSPVTFSIGPGRYYVALRHRNHLGVMTASPVPILGPGVMVNFAFTAGSPVYGTEPLKTGALTYTRLMWAGNAHHDAIEKVKYAGANNDRDPVLARIGGTVPTATTPGYYLEDITMDGVVKYTGATNDRDPILVNIGGTVPSTVRMEQVP